MNVCSRQTSFRWKAERTFDGFYFHMLHFHTAFWYHILPYRWDTWNIFKYMFMYILACYTMRYAHYIDVIMGATVSQITSLTIVYSTVYSGEEQRKHQSSASLAFVRGIRRWPVNSKHKWSVTRSMFPFDDVIMIPICRALFCCGYIMGFNIFTHIFFRVISLARGNPMV